jgi:hypothetical protein
MKTCKYFEPLFKGLMAGQLSQEQQEALDRHARECGECLEMLRLHEQLRADFAGSREMQDPGLERVRSVVLGIIQDRRTRRRSFRLLGRPGWAFAFSFLLLVLGFFSAIFWGRLSGADRGSAIYQMRLQAEQNKRLADSENSPFIYSNVSLRDIGQSKVDLSFDATVHMDVSVDKSDPLVKEVLVQTLLNQAPLDARLKAVGYAGGLRTPEVKEALLSAMLYDPEVAVRLKSLTILTSYLRDSQIQSAFLQVLKRDSSVQMRLMALDCVARADPAVLRNAMPELQLKGDTAVLVKAMGYLQ